MATHPEPTTDDKPHQGNWYVLIAGLPKPSERIILASGLTLAPLDAELTVFDLAGAGAAGFREWSMLERASSGCTCEIESARDSDVTPGYDTLNRAWLASTMMVLRGFSAHLAVACSSYSWNAIAGHERRTAGTFRTQMEAEGVEAAIFRPVSALAPFKGKLLDFHARFFVNRDTRVDALSSADASWISQHFDTFNLLASQSESFRLALEAVTDWRFSKESRTAIARIWCGIEAIFGVQSELVYRISTLCASLLAERGAARKARFQAVKRLYGLRSKAVHGEQLSREQLATAMSDSHMLLRELLLLTIEKGRVLGPGDFDDALFD